MATEFVTSRDGSEFGDQLLPPGQTFVHDLKTPSGIAGSFLVHGVVREVDPDRMVPTEEVLPGAHIPLFIIPDNFGGRWDDDHGRFEINDPRLQGPDRRPLRYTHVQYLPRVDHERKNRMLDAIEIPEGPTATFQAVLLGAAKYVTRRAIDLSGKKPVVVDASDALRAEMHRNNWIRMQRSTQWKVGFYLAQFILTNGIDAIRETTEVARFLDANNERARKFASFGVVRKAVLNVVDAFEPTYEIARRQGAIRCPEPTAARFITQYFDRHQPDYVSTIADRLLVA